LNETINNKQGAKMKTLILKDKDFDKRGFYKGCKSLNFFNGHISINTTLDECKFLELRAIGSIFSDTSISCSSDVESMRDIEINSKNDDFGLDVFGDIKCGTSLASRTEIKATGSILAGAYITTYHGVTAGEDIASGGMISTSAHIAAGGNIKAIGCIEAVRINAGRSVYAGGGMEIISGSDWLL
jgi:hypothetical protein